MKVESFSVLKRASSNLLTLVPFVVMFTSALLLSSCGSSQTQLLSEAGSVEKRLSAKLQPTVRSWITDEAVKLARFSAEEDGIQAAIERRFVGQNLDDEGREVLTFLMIARASDISNQQSRLFEEHQRAIRATTEKMREVLPKLQADLKKHVDLHDLAPVPPDLARYKEEIRKIALLVQRTPSWITFVTDNAGDDIMALRAAQEDLEKMLDGMNEMSEMTSLRLQMMMDRRSKFISTLSNIMKKITTTQETLVQNLK